MQEDSVKVKVEGLPMPRSTLVPETAGSPYILIQLPLYLCSNEITDRILFTRAFFFGTRQPNFFVRIDNQRFLGDFECLPSLQSGIVCTHGDAKLKRKLY